MAYHIDTGLIKEKFKTDCECPLCEIRTVAEEQFLHEFLNDAVMEENMRGRVNKLGFCATHLDMLLSRQNKLSVALQVSTRLDTIMKNFDCIGSVKTAIKQADKLDEMGSTCVICDLINASMEKYYRTIAEMFKKEPSFRETLKSSKGFCLPHYSMLLRYAKYAGSEAEKYVETICDLQYKHLARIGAELKIFCDKHDYRNALMPLGKAETALPRTRQKLFGKKLT